MLFVGAAALSDSQRQKVYSQFKPAESVFGSASVSSSESSCLSVSQWHFDGDRTMGSGVAAGAVLPPALGDREQMGTPGPAVRGLHSSFPGKHCPGAFGEWE